MSFGPVLRITALLFAVSSCASPSLPPPIAAPPPRRLELTTVVKTADGTFDPLDRDGDGIGDAYDLCPSTLEDGRGERPYDGCPEDLDPRQLARRWGSTPHQAMTVTHDQIKITEEIRFARSSATIDPSSQPLIASLAQALQDTPEIEVLEIAGHADASGSDDANKRLTLQRSSAVLLALVAEGISRARLRASGYSSYCPVDPRMTEAAAVTDRRVEFRILRRAGAELGLSWGGCEVAMKHGMRPPVLPPRKGSAGAADASSDCTTANPKECSDRCDLGEIEACVTLAAALGGGPSADPGRPGADPRGAFDALTKACALGDLGACALAALALRGGVGLAKDAKRAHDIAESACAKGGGAACAELGRAQREGAGTPQDGAKSVESYRRACDLGDGQGCQELGKKFWFGVGVRADHARALDLFVAACEVGGGGCAMLRDRVKDDPSALRNRARALVALHVACEQDGDEQGCDALRIVTEEPGEYSPPPVCSAGDFAACQAACRGAPAGDPCVELGTALLYGTGARRRVTEATTMFDDACREGNARGCSMSALLRESKGPEEHTLRVAADRFEMACTKGEMSGCVNLARMQRDGIGTYRNETAAKRTFDAACAQGVGIACAYRAAIAEKGLGGPADPARARALLDRACAIGFRSSCAAAVMEAKR